MNCCDCPIYDEDRQKCRDGKLNPASYGAAIEVANVFGVRAIFSFNDHKQRLVSTRACAFDGKRPAGTEQTKLP